MRQAQAGKQVKRAAQGIVLGIDIGGTFTDYVAYDKGSENRGQPGSIFQMLRIRRQASLMV